MSHLSLARHCGDHPVEDHPNAPIGAYPGASLEARIETASELRFVVWCGVLWTARS